MIKPLPYYYFHTYLLFFFMGYFLIDKLSMNDPSNFFLKNSLNIFFFISPLLFIRKMPFKVLLTLFLPVFTSFISLFRYGFDSDTLVSIFLPFRFLLLGVVIYYNRQYFKPIFDKYLIFFVVLNSIASGLVLYFPDYFFDFFLPYSSSDSAVKVASSFDGWDSTIWGLWSNQISLAYFSLFSLFYLYYNRKLSPILFFLLAFCAIFSGSITVSFFFLLFAMYIYFGKHVSYLFLLLPLFFLIFFDFFVPGLSFDDFVYHFSNTRLSILLDVPYFLYLTDPWSFLFGFGKTQNLLDVLFSMPLVPESLVGSLSLAPIEDVYIVSFVIYFGVFLSAIFMFAFVYWFKPFLGLGIYRYILFVCFLGSFFNQVLVLLPASFFIVIFLFLRPAQFYE